MHGVQCADLLTCQQTGRVIRQPTGSGAQSTPACSFLGIEQPCLGGSGAPLWQLSHWDGAVQEHPGSLSPSTGEHGLRSPREQGWGAGAVLCCYCRLEPHQRDKVTGEDCVRSMRRWEMDIPTNSRNPLATSQLLQIAMDLTSSLTITPMTLCPTVLTHSSPPTPPEFYHCLKGDPLAHLFFR